MRDIEFARENTRARKAGNQSRETLEEGQENKSSGIQPMTDEKKQLEKELTEMECPECLGISFYGDWKYVKDGKDYGLQCPKCGIVCDVE